MIPVAEILTATDTLLNDAERVRWPADERLGWMNECMGAILNRRPAAFASRVVMALVAGSYQEISGAYLLDVTRNMAADGTTAGSSIRRTDRQLLDDTDPDWHKGKQKAKIRNYAFDDRMPRVFYCYPPAIANTKVETLQAVLPAAAVIDGNLEIPAEYKSAVVNYVAFRSHLKDTDFSERSKAISYFQAFENDLGAKTQAETASSPNQPTNSV